MHVNKNFFLLLIGQYTGKQKPLVEFHVQIAGFDERVCIHFLTAISVLLEMTHISSKETFAMDNRWNTLLPRYEYCVCP